MHIIIKIWKIENFMKVVQRINEILQERNISKRELAKRLINLDMKAIKEEEDNYVKMPLYYSFKDSAGNDRKNEILMANFRRINKEVEMMINEIKEAIA